MGLAEISAVKTIAAMKLFLCVVLLLAVGTSAYPYPQGRSFISCSLCKSFITQVENNISDPTNVANVATELKKACEFIFPNNMDNQNNCKNTIDTYLPQIIDSLINSYG